MEDIAASWLTLYEEAERALTALGVLAVAAGLAPAEVDRIEGLEEPAELFEQLAAFAPEALSDDELARLGYVAGLVHLEEAEDFGAMLAETAQAALPDAAPPAAEPLTDPHAALREAAQALDAAGAAWHRLAEACGLGLAQLARLMTAVEVPAGEALAPAGDPRRAEQLYVLGRGALEDAREAASVLARMAGIGAAHLDEVLYGG